MAQPRVIREYRAALLAELPAAMAWEVSDGLAEACEKYRREGLTPAQAAESAVAEFGDPALVIEAFSRTSSARRAARTLVATGPAVALCWAAALVTARAWQWHLPGAIPLVFGAVLACSILALLTGARSRRYRPARRCGRAGCIGLAALDGSSIAVVLAAAPELRWLTVLAICASAARITSVARTMLRAAG